VKIVGATGQTYRLTRSDFLHRLYVQEGASNLYGSGGPATSTFTRVIL
jgi:hypothetical protein